MVGRRVLTAGPDCDPGEPDRGARDSVAIAAWCAVVCLLVLLGVRRLWDYDAFWQMAMGDWIRSHRLPTTDPFGIIEPPPAVHHTSWLYCVGLSVVVGGVGIGGAIVMKAITLAAAFATAALTGADARPARVLRAALAALAGMAASQRFALRPEFVACGFAAAFLWILDRATRRWTASVWLLPIGSVLWANTHATFPVGLGLVGAWCVATLLAETPAFRKRTAVLVLLLCAAGSLVTPEGFGTVRLAWQHFGLIVGPSRAAEFGWIAAAGGAGLVALLLIGRRVVRAAAPIVVAWGGLAACAAIAVRAASGAGGDAPTLERIVITELATPVALSLRFTAMPYFWVLALLASASLLVRPRGVGLLHAAATVGGLALAMTAVRNVGLFAILALPTVANALAAVPLPRRLRASTIDGVRACLVGLLTVFCVAQGWMLVTDRFSVRQGDTNQFGLGIARFHVPESAADLLLAEMPAARIFCSPAPGSYLAWRGLRPYVDTRMMSAQLIGYVAAARSPASMAALLESQRIDAVVCGLGEAQVWGPVGAMEGWRPVLVRGDGIVFAREGSTLAMRHPPAGDWPGRLRESLGAVVPATSASAWSRVESAWRFRAAGEVCLAWGRPGEAFGFFDTARLAEPRAFTRWDALAITAEAAGRPDVAAPAWEAHARTLPSDVAARFWLAAARVYRQIGNNAAADAAARAAGPPSQPGG